MNRKEQTRKLIYDTCPHARGDEPPVPATAGKNIHPVPTHVGMNLRPWSDNPRYSTCPHARGDEPFIIMQKFLGANLSPRTWG